MKKHKHAHEAQVWADLETIAIEGKKRLMKKGLTEKDIPNLVERRREAGPKCCLYSRFT